MDRSGKRLELWSLAAALVLLAAPAAAEIGSRRTTTIQCSSNGAQVAARTHRPTPCRSSISRITRQARRTVEAPGSVVGPPMAVASRRIEAMHRQLGDQARRADVGKIVPTTASR